MERTLVSLNCVFAFLVDKVAIAAMPNSKFLYLQLCELSFHKTRHLRNPYNENLPVKVLFGALNVRF